MKATVALFLFAGLATGLALPVRSALGGDAATEEARQHFQKGRQLFDVGRWDDAAAEFEQAYAIRSDPIFLYNMAQAYRRKGDAKRALDLYKNYLIKAPKSPQREEVEERILALQKQIDEADHAVKPPTQNPSTPGAATPVAGSPEVARAPAPAPNPAPPPSSVVPAPASYPPPAAAPVPAQYPQTAASSNFFAPVPYPPPPVASAPAQAVYPAATPTPAGYPPAATAVTLQPQPGDVQTQATPPPDTPGRGLRIGGIVCGAVGLASIGAGIAFGLEARSYSHSVETASVFNPNFDDRGKLFETLQYVGYGVGAGLLATGAILYGFGVASASTSKVALSPAVLPGGAGLTAQGTF